MINQSGFFSASGPRAKAKPFPFSHHLLIDLEVGATFMVYLDEVKVLIALLYSCVFVLLTLRPLLLCVRRPRLYSR